MKKQYSIVAVITAQQLLSQMGLSANSLPDSNTMEVELILLVTTLHEMPRFNPLLSSLIDKGISRLCTEDVTYVITVKKCKGPADIMTHSVHARLLIMDEGKFYNDNNVEVFLTEADTVALFLMCITDGLACIPLYKAASKTSTVVGVFCFMDNEFPVTNNNLEECPGLKVTSFLTHDLFTEVAFDTGLINERRRDQIIELRDRHVFKKNEEMANEHMEH